MYELLNKANKVFQISSVQFCFLTTLSYLPVNTPAFPYAQHHHLRIGRFDMSTLYL